ncbi:MAG: hypothetical protein VYC19_04925 [Pseudomonadota bacterium]|jgi:hypothetical protein|nr:hypothetical protein [Pseudomonadota bacterium]MEC9236902.1 hypothetical protein [Pseudomonadota bacterium]
MTQYKRPFSAPKLTKAYMDACQITPQTCKSLAARIEILRQIMDQRRESIEDHYEKNSGDATKRLGVSINLKS